MIILIACSIGLIYSASPGCLVVIFQSYIQSYLCGHSLIVSRSMMGYLHNCVLGSLAYAGMTSLLTISKSAFEFPGGDTHKHELLFPLLNASFSDHNYAILNLT